MPQVFHVLRCYECFTFQIHIRKKTFKWECKMCGVKQSIKRTYGVGNNKDCRLHVQKLNLMQSNNCPKYDKFSVYISDDSDDNENMSLNIPPVAPAKISKWTHFIDKHDVQEEPSLSNTSEKYAKKYTKQPQGDDEFLYEKNNKEVYNGNIKNKTSRFVSPLNVDAYPSFEINKTSMCTNFSQISNGNTHREPASLLNEQYDLKNNKFSVNKESTISPSKWSCFFDKKGLSSQLSLDPHFSGDAIKIKSDVEESSTELDKNLQSTSRNVKSNDTKLNFKRINSNIQFHHQSMFSMTTDEELDSILDF